MKKLLKLCIIAFFLIFFWKTFWFDINTLGSIDSSVIDQVEILSWEEKKQIETKIEEIRNKYTAEILLVMISTTNGEDIASLGTEIWQKVGVWKSDIDNGVVILIALDDRAWNISTWYGVEWVLPDLLVNKLWEKHFSLFREQKYFDGIYWLLNDIDTVLSWDKSIISSESENQWDISFLLVINFFIAMILSSIFLKPLQKRREIKKLLSFVGIAYLLTLPLTIIAVGVIWILVNIWIWIFWWFFWIFWEAGKWNGGRFWWWGGSSSWWFWWFGGGGFWWWGSSWKW